MDDENGIGFWSLFWIGLGFFVLLGVAMLYADKSVREECAAAQERDFYFGTNDADEACYLADPY
ncbi:MAG: hypothetical protein NUW01_07045 [Gemmatimonadaceae bacterium]|nr:hypothetical protein [Gemmatimonadaceae bacterium]